MLNFEFPVTLVRCRLHISNVPSVVLEKRALRCVDEFDDPDRLRLLANPYGYTQIRIWYNIVFEIVMRYLMEGSDDGAQAQLNEKKNTKITAFFFLILFNIFY